MLRPYVPHGTKWIGERRRVRKDNSDRYSPFLFSLKSVSVFALFKKKVLNACSASRTNAQLYCNHSDCKVNLSSATWELFVYFLKSR